LIPVVGYVGLTEGLFYYEVDDAYHHAVEAEDEHGAKRDESDAFTLYSV
jgi:hypothetical protein